MRNKYEQVSLCDTYKTVVASMEEDKARLFRLLDEHIDWDTLIPARFYTAFYWKTGRPRKYPLVAFLKRLVLKKIFGIPAFCAALLNGLNCMPSIPPFSVPLVRSNTTPV